MISQWARVLIAGVVLTICGLSAALAIDCHIRRPDQATCDNSDDRALATLTGVLATLLALRVPQDDDGQPR